MYTLCTGYVVFLYRRGRIRVIMVFMNSTVGKTGAALAAAGFDVFRNGRNSVSIIHVETGIEIVEVHGEWCAQKVLEALLAATDLTEDFLALRRIAFVARQAFAVRPPDQGIERCQSFPFLAAPDGESA